MPPHLVLDMTMREIGAYSRGAAKRAKGEQVWALTIAWQTANLTRAKRLPSLKSILSPFYKPASELGSVISRMRRIAEKRGLPEPKARK